MSKAEAAAAIFQKHVGTEDEPGEWFEIDQKRINEFAECTLDRQFIHVDPEMSAQNSPYGVTIAHGFLTLSMLSYLQASVKSSVPAEALDGMMMGVNYGFEKVRFVAPVKVDSKIRLRRKLSAAEFKAPNAVQLTYTCTIEVEGGEKPACVAEWLTRMMFA